MSLWRKDARTDANQPEIVEALEKAGALVFVIREPVDLLVGFGGYWTPLEVKDGKKPKSRQALTPQQAQFIAACRPKLLPVAVVKTIEDALHAIGAVR